MSTLEVHSDPEEVTNREKILDAMLHRIAVTPGTYLKSQQRGEPDLTMEERVLILRNLYDDRPCAFLSRYEQMLTEKDVVLFAHVRGMYEADFFLKRIEMKKNRLSNVEIKNRRYTKLRQLINEGEYFSDCEMQRREPFLYDQMIARYMTNEESAKKLHTEEINSLSGVLLQLHDSMMVNDERNKQQDIYQRQKMMDWSSSSDEEDSDGGLRMKVLQEEKDQSREDFIRIMHERFLAGADDFDYREVDEDPRYDALDVIEFEEQERYFECSDQEEK
uniref:CCD97-like C-terminal domain-containing protein n=1 Tax=Trichuris muris TaxID=70415 RepID=A0A5S6PZY2_TRIMR